jgi:O-antigen/teichoic acid export membrane protein
MTDGRSLVRNSAFNIIGLVVPVVLAVVAIPPLVRGFGPDRFGILTLAWAAIGYFSLFELGLSRALTQAVAQRLGGSDRHEIASIVWTTQALLFALGSCAGIVLALATPAIVGRALSVPAELRPEAMQSF